MRILRPTTYWWAPVLCLLLVMSTQTQGEDDVGLDPTMKRVYAKMHVLFDKHYPKVTSTILYTNCILFAYNVTMFEFPYTGPDGRKHESTKQQGPKPGGILCKLWLEKGSPVPQIALPMNGKSIRPTTRDRQHFKTLINGPYSPKMDVRLLASLSYPSDVKEEFLIEFQTLISDFPKYVIGDVEQTVGGDSQPAQSGYRTPQP